MREWLLTARKKKGMSQSEIAEMCGIKAPSYCTIENGKNFPSIATAKKIAAVLNFPWTKFFEEEKEDAE